MTTSNLPKTALVTGSTSGIGLAIAKSLAHNGWQVALHGMGTPEDVNQCVDEVWATNTLLRPMHFKADLRSPQEARRLVEKVQGTFGKIDLLVNNAGMQFTARVEEFPTTKWDEIISINLSSVFHTSAAVLPAMQGCGYGRIVNIASVHGLVASAEKAAYVAAKHGVVGLTKTIALENAKTDITCNAICPGWVRTPLVEVQIKNCMKNRGLSYEDATTSLLAEKEPTGRFTTPQQVAAAVLFLASEACDNVTGTNLAMDGGWSAQ